MDTFVGYNFNRVYPKMADQVMYYGEEAAPVANIGEVRKTRELHPAIVEVENPAHHLITSVGRPINVAFAAAEVLWILQGRNDVEMLSFYNSNIAQFSDDGETFNAAYGDRLRRAFGHDQILDVVETLKADPESRRAVLSIWHPQYDRGFEYSFESTSDFEDQGVVTPLKRSVKDRACNLMAILLLRNGKLEWTQVQRSNDLIWGTPYNYMQFSHIQRWIANLLGVEVGRFTHVINSLHVYSDFYEEASAIRDFDLYHQVHPEELRHWEQWGRVSDGLLRELGAMEQKVRNYESLPDAVMELPPYWHGFIGLFAAHAAYRAGKDEACFNILKSSCHPVYGKAQMRFYWYNRWHKDQYRERMSTAIGRFDERIADWIMGSA